MFNFPVRLVAMIAILIAPAAGSLGAQTSPAHVHVELTVTTTPCINSYGGDTGSTSLCAETRDVRPRNFILSQAGQPLPFRLTTPSDKTKEPVHLLVLAPTEPAGVVWAMVSHALAQAWARGWSVSIAASDKQTAYAGSEKELATAIQSGVATSLDAGHALQQLQSIAGPRVLLITEATPRASLARYTQLIPEVYVVDGGLLTERTTFEPIYLSQPCYSANTGINDNCSDRTYSPWIPNSELSPAVTIKGLRTGLMRGVWHEKNLGAALRQAVRNSNGYFDLEADVPSAALQSEFDLQLRKLPAGLRLKADAYAERNGQREGEPKLVLSQR